MVFLIVLNIVLFKLTSISFELQSVMIIESVRTDKEVTVYDFLLVVAAILGVATYYSIYTLFAILVYLLLLSYYTSKKVVFIIVSTILLFVITSHLHAYLQKTSLSNATTQMNIRFHELIKTDGNIMQSVVKTDKGEKLLLRYTFKSLQEKEEFVESFQLGSVCSIYGNLEVPEKNRNVNAFNYQQYLASKGIHWILKSKQNPLDFCERDKKTIIEHIKYLRLKGLQYIERNFSPETKGFAAALLFGDSEWIAEKTYSSYKKLSLVHILAISGLHVAIVSGCLFFMGIRIGLTRQMTKIILLLLLPIFCIIAGGEPSVVRACVTVMLFFTLSLFRVRCSPVTLLGVLFLFLLLLNPFYIVQVGFQLSFFITFALLMSKKIITSWKNKSVILQSFMVTVICQVFSFPILLYFFQETSLWGFILNVLYIPLYTVVLLPLTLFAFLFSILQLPFSNIVMLILDSLFYISNRMAEGIAKFPFVTLIFSKPSLIVAFIITIIIVLCFIHFERRNQKTVKRSLCILFSILFFLYFKVSISPIGEVTFIDVGQGDCVLIKRPFGNGVYLIDTGGVLMFNQEKWMKKSDSFEPGSDIVVPFLKSKGIRQIDKLILTHDDQDHIGGVKAVLQEIKIREIVIAKSLQKEFEKTDIWEEALQKKIPIKLIGTGYGWKVGRDTFSVVHPSKFEDNSNETSIVLSASVNGVRWLFTGDLGFTGEEALMKRNPSLQTDILKIGHHGSKNSSSEAFVDQLNPKIAIIMAGNKNRYGHPHYEVLEVLNKYNVQVLRTDRHGAITYRYLFKRGTFSGMLP